jgi:hypothetical protein
MAKQNVFIEKVQRNTCLGTSALAPNLTGAIDNVAIGDTALNSISMGDQNTAVESASLQSLTAGSSLTALGYQALKLNTATGTTALGSSALAANTSPLDLLLSFTKHLTQEWRSQGTFMTWFPRR